MLLPELTKVLERTSAAERKDAERIARHTLGNLAHYRHGYSRESNDVEYLAAVILAERQSVVWLPQEHIVNGKEV